jgi:hypothetical protein
MIITNVCVSCSMVISIGKYKTIKPFVSLTADLEDTDDIDQVIKFLHKETAKYWTESAARELKWMLEIKEITPDLALPALMQVDKLLTKLDSK